MDSFKIIQSFNRNIGIDKTEVNTDSELFKIGRIIAEYRPVDEATDIFDMDILPHRAIHEIRIKLYTIGGFTETFGILEKIEGFTKDGLPEVGTTIEYNSIVISKYITTDNGTFDRSIRLKSIRKGKVVFAAIANNEAIVYLEEY